MGGDDGRVCYARIPWSRDVSLTLDPVVLHGTGDIGGFRMRKQPAVATRTRELPLEISGSDSLRPMPTPPPERRAADRFKDALLRWLEEEL